MPGTSGTVTEVLPSGSGRKIALRVRLLGCGTAQGQELLDGILCRPCRGQFLKSEAACGQTFLVQPLGQIPAFNLAMLEVAHATLDQASNSGLTFDFEGTLHEPVGRS